ALVRTPQPAQLRLPRRRRPPRRLPRRQLRQRPETWRPRRRPQGPVARRRPPRRPPPLAALARLARLALARDRPLPARLVRALLAADHPLLRLADLAAPPEIDAVGQAHRRARRPQPPAGPARQPQQRRLPVLRQRRRDIRMQVEADGERPLAAAA